MTRHAHEQGAGRQTGTRQASQHTGEHDPSSRAGGRSRARARLPLLGAQISTAGGFAPVPGRAAAIGAEVVQIFSSNPRTWQTRAPEPEEMAAFVADMRGHALPLFFHTIYLINLASPDVDLRRRSGEALAHALALGTLAGAAGVVTHVGSHRGDGFAKALGRVAAVAYQAMETAAIARGGPLPPLLLETGVGAGALVGSRLEELAALLATLPPTADSPEPGVCVDTAHLFAAGYALHEPEGLESLIDDLRRLDLLARVGLVHLNDSAAPFASNRDLHENPGDGQIGYRGLARIVTHPALAHVPFVLEVPGADGHGPDAGNLSVVKLMRAGAPAPPRAPVPGA